MAVIEGIVDNQGNIIRMRGTFQVIQKQNNILDVKFPDQNTSLAFVLATAWRNDGDISISNAAISVSPKTSDAENMLFAVDDYYGVSFRVDTGR